MIRIKKINHVQICIPIGEEERGKAFYGGVLGLEEIPKPESLIPNGGMWYRVGDIELHIGVEKMGEERSKRHPAFEVERIHEVRKYLEQQGVKTQDEKPIPGVTRFSFFDPFGNRIEFLEKNGEASSIADQVKASVQKQFGQHATSYVKSVGHAKGEDLKKLIDIADLNPNHTALDVATGGGHVANALAPFVKNVVALDLTKEILEAAKEFVAENGHQNVDFIQGDAEEVPCAAEQFDIVTCRIAPHHFPHIERFIAEVKRVLKPEGQFLLIDNVAAEDDEVDQFYNEVEKRRDFSHFRAWKKSEWLKMLEDQGFVVTEWHRFEKVFKFDTWCDRMGLSMNEKEKLSRDMLAASEKVKERLKIVEKDGVVYSFQGESILLKAIKPSQQIKQDSFMW